MYTLNHYEAMAEEVRALMIKGKPVPPEYQQVIEEFMPTEDKFPERRVITIYEYPDSNPDLFLENKRGFRLQFMFLFLSNEQAANFYEDVSRNGPLKWQIARFYLEVVDNMVFVKTRGQRASNMLAKIQNTGKTQPLCVFHYNVKMRTLLKIIEDGNWSLRVVWGPAVNIPLHGGDLEKEENLAPKLEPKLEVKFRKEEIEPEIQKKVKGKEYEEQLNEDILVKPTEFYVRLAQEVSMKILLKNVQQQ